MIARTASWPSSLSSPARALRISSVTRASTSVTSGVLATRRFVRRTASGAWAAMAWHSHGRTGVRFVAQGATRQGGTFSGGRASMGGLWVPQGSSVRYWLTRPGSAGVAFYERVD